MLARPRSTVIPEIVDIILVDIVSLNTTPIDQILTKEITNLMKIYLDKEKKYRGEMYDILDTKL